MPGESSGTSIGSPGGLVFASPASYSPLPAMLTPEFRRPTGVYTARADVPDHIPASAPQLGRQVSVSSSAGSPLTPVHPANMSSPFFPQTDSRLPPQPALSSFARPHASSFHSAASQQPLRRATLHAATPSFHPAATSRSFDPAPFPWSLPQYASRVAGLRRSESVSLRPGDDPLRSPTLSRASSASPALPIKREEPKRRKIVVRLPRELDSGGEPDLRFGEGDAMPEEDGTKDGQDKDKRPRSTIRRVPLKDAEHPREDAANNQRVESLVGREQHEDEVKKSELPSAIDVYLPGKAAWEEVWDAFEQQMKGSYGYCVSHFAMRPRNLLTSRRAGRSSSRVFSVGSRFAVAHFLRRPVLPQKRAWSCCVALCRRLALPSAPSADRSRFGPRRRERPQPVHFAFSPDSVWWYRLAGLFVPLARAAISFASPPQPDHRPPSVRRASPYFAARQGGSNAASNKSRSVGLDRCGWTAELAPVCGGVESRIQHHGGARRRGC